ncbi:hypothetical protein SAMN00120144_2023 [Hymenobacter roseosalivarius DSM 11622]|uniref:Uncharacterized protein n=1 Tax=Hymenobacter roseosalivarius DSM 11622 TaxID=645990 RepID=A0A1W1VMH1_9BACT|nr:hypothetical protein SAMN00120144_2023 [Hymenobacter roseosalivarius DSM 11622]
MDYGSQNTANLRKNLTLKQKKPPRKSLGGFF